MVWSATNIANLNECTGTASATGKNTDQTGPWSISVTQSEGRSNQDLIFAAEISGSAAAGYTALTPTFTNIGK